MSKLTTWNIRQAAANLRLSGMDVNPKVVELYEDYYDGKISYDFFHVWKDQAYPGRNGCSRQ